MLSSTGTLLLICVLYTLVQCEIPNLNVRKMDKSLIAQKRRDTFDMCRIFTAENAKIEHSMPKIIKSYEIKNTNYRRQKREIDTKYAVNPALNEADVARVEKIVEKLYDDMEERGQKVDYTKSSVATTTTTTQKPTSTPSAGPSRRFFFAPELIVAGQTSPPPALLHDDIIADHLKARWKHGIVPYFIDSKTYDAHLQEVIMKAFDYIEKATCIRLQKLRERPTDMKSLQEVEWVYITNPTGIRQCVHSNEQRKLNGVQMSVFGYDCMSLGDIVHEVMHILGFSHEHTRSDRDQYISIFWDNVKPGYRKYFETAKPGNAYVLESLPYDYASVMHYPPRAFSKNGQLTIWAQSGVKIGQREGLSEIDVEKVGTIYSGECVERNREYLLKTCPSVVNTDSKKTNISQNKIDEYFKDRLWPYGIVSYKLRDKIEFSTEEKENIKAVIRHIEKETCIQFKDVTAEEDEHDAEDNDVSSTQNLADEENTPGNEVLGQESFEEEEESETPTANVPGPAIEVNVETNINNNKQKKDRKETTTTKNSRKPWKKPGGRKPKKLMQENDYRRKGGRRHADSVMVLTRSADPGCKCPSPGKSGVNEALVINADCFNSVNDLLHLFVHVLGLDHQHNMYDRDAYLHIVWENLTPDVKKELSHKLPPAASVGFDYDYQSVMHYPWLQIKNGVSNMMYPIWNDGWAMGHWQGLSSFDVQKLNLLYFDQCNKRSKHE